MSWKDCYPGDLPARLAEASWLAACILIPVSADLQAGQIFTAPKTALTQILGICSVLALGVDFVSRPRVEKSFLPIAVAALAFLAVSFASQAYAIDPSRAGDTGGVVSLGPAHLACQIALFLSVAYFLRTARQLERLVYATLATGFVVAAFALFEAYGFKAPGHAVVPGMQVVSFVGGPIFLAGYLLMLVPLAIWNLHRNLEKSGGRLDKPVATAAVVLLVLLAAFLACDKRGPTMGLLAAICSGLILLAAVRRQYRLILAASVTVVLATLSLTSLAVLKKAKSPLAKIPFIERLAAIVPVDGDRNHDYRTMLWALLPDMVVSTEPLILPSGSEDPHHHIRLLLGYGPDNLQAVLPSRYIFLQAWPSEVMEVSSHNHFWDLAINLGVFGLAAFFALFFVAWYRGLLAIGARPPPFGLSIALAALCTVASSAVAGSILQPGFFGVAAQVGFLAGLLALCLPWFKSIQGAPDKPSPTQLLFLALLASLAGHWIDLVFIFPTAENSIMFWVFAGALCARVATTDTNPSFDKEHGGAPRKWAFAIGAALLISVIHARANLGPMLAGQAGLSSLFGSGKTLLYQSFLAVIAVWVSCRLCWPRERGTARKGADANCWQTIAAGLLYLAAILWLARWTETNPPTFSAPYLVDIWALHFPILAIVGVIGVAFSTMVEVRRPPLISVVAGCLLFLLSAALIWTGPLKDLRSSASAGFARWLPQSAQWLERSISLRPELMRNYYRLANELMLRAFVTQKDAANKASALQKAEEILQQGRRVSGFNLLGAKLGKLSLWRALQEEGSSNREALAEVARQALAEAVRFAPQNEPAWLDASLVERWLFGDEESAESMLRRADDATLRAAPWQNVVKEQWGYYYAGLAATAPDKKIAKQYARRSLKYLDLHLEQTDEALRELPSSEANETIRSEILHSRAKTLFHAGDAMRILGLEEAAAAKTAEAEEVQRELNRTFGHKLGR